MLDDLLQKMLETEKEAQERVHKATEESQTIKRNGHLEADARKKELEQETLIMTHQIIDQASQKAKEEKEKLLSRHTETIQQKCSEIQKQLDLLIPEFVAILTGNSTPSI